MPVWSKIPSIGWACGRISVEASPIQYKSPGTNCVSAVPKAGRTGLPDVGARKEGVDDGDESPVSLSGCDPCRGDRASARFLFAGTLLASGSEDHCGSPGRGL